MDSPSSRNPPSFKNITPRHKQSPIEIKEKMRKNYRDKIQNCRNMLLNRFRSTGESDIKDELTGIYESLFNLNEELNGDEEETKILEVVKNELIEEELKWCLEEYEKSQLENYDWSVVEKDDNIICPVCQKTNFTLQKKRIKCLFCKIDIETDNSLLDIKKHILNLIENHNSTCTSNVQFTVVPDINDHHIFLICDTCMQMQLLI